MERKDGASCLVIFLIEHELKAVRKKVTSFVSDDTAEKFPYFLYDFNALCILERIWTRPVIVGE